MGGSKDVGGEADDVIGAAVAIFLTEGAPALAIGINDAEFNMEDFLATPGAFGRQ